MADRSISRFTEIWRERLNLGGYGPPDLITSQEQISGTQYASILRTGFDDLGLNGFLCIQNVPTIAFLVQDEHDEQEITRIHNALWNQGAARLLLVLLPQQVRAYSLLAPPTKDDLTKKDSRLIQSLDLVACGLQLAELISGVQSGRYFEEHAAHFGASTRIDNVLVDNLTETYRELAATGLQQDNAHALLMQMMFIAYLEDRGLINSEYIQSAVRNQQMGNLVTLLESGDPQLVHRLFKRLNENFNSDIFIAPCAFGKTNKVPTLRQKHLHLLAEFRRGTVDFKTGQGRFWPYDFRYIPVELISAVYDRLLADTPERKREGGVYYTPSFLADFVVDQAWDLLPIERRNAPDFTVLDPACGSAIFLVRVFHRMVEDWRTIHQGAKPTWKTLVALVSRLHGWDKQESAVRIGAFSLYIALLEQAPRAALGKLLEAKKLLPPLFGKNLQVRDFFDEKIPPDDAKYSLITGNPPWVSRRREATATATRWCKVRNLPMPANELAWGFVWRALELSKAPDGLTAFLLPAMGMLLNLEEGANNARKLWLSRVRLHRVINLADTSFLLFEGAKRPTVLCLYTPTHQEQPDYTFEYWCPKASRFLGYARMLALTSADKIVLSVSRVLEDPRVWPRYQWTANRDLKLLNWLGTLPKLGDKLATYRESRKKDFAHSGKHWIIGQGFIPAIPENIGKKDYRTERLSILKGLPYLSATALTPFVVRETMTKFGSDLVYRKGFTTGFYAPHVLIPQGVERRTGLLRAAYNEQNCCFQDSLQTIHFPPEDAPWMKLLTAVLNSKLAAWYLFHETGNLGADRAKVNEWELGELPFPKPDELPNPTTAHKAMQSIVSVMDNLLRDKDRLLSSETALRETAGQLDQLVYAYFGLSKEEIAVVEDTVNYVIASMQPRPRKTPPLWQASQNKHWEAYASTLGSAVERWLKPGFHLGISVVGVSQDLVVIRLTMHQAPPTQRFQVQTNEGVGQILPRIHTALPRQVSRNLLLVPDLRIFIDNDLYVVKPRVMRYWLRSAALNDADAIVEELYAATLGPGRRKLN